MKLWFTLVLLTACAARPAPVGPRPAPPSRPSIEGHVTGYDGHPLAFAHVKLMDAARKVLTEADARNDGSFAVPALSGTDSVYALEASGVGHRPTTALLARGDEHVAIELRLGTYGEAHQGRPQLLVYERGEAQDDTHPLTATDRGTYTVDVPLPNGTYSYVLLAVAAGHAANGTDSPTYEVDADGDVRSRVTVTDGTLHVAFDPRKAPPPGQPAITTFADARSTSARLTDLHARVRIENDDYLNALLSEMRASRPVDALKAAHKQALHAVIDPLLRDATGTVWQAAVMASLAAFVRPPPSDDDRRMVTRLFAAVPPADVLWDYFPDAIFRALQVAEPTSTYGDAFVRDHANARTVGKLLVARVHASHDPVEARSLVGMLRTPRFAGTPAQEDADDLDPDRVLVAGKPFPSFALATLPEAGPSTNITPRTFAGKPYLVDMWATWCAPCVAGMAHLRELHAKYGTRLGMLGISVDAKTDTVVAFRKKHPMPWPTVMSTEDEVKALTGIKSLGFPTMVLVDAKGMIVGVDHGPESLEKELEKLLP